MRKRRNHRVSNLAGTEKANPFSPFAVKAFVGELKAPFIVEHRVYQGPQYVGRPNAGGRHAGAYQAVQMRPDNHIRFHVVDARFKGR
jgi:hypothetical protein